MDVAAIFRSAPFVAAIGIVLSWVWFTISDGLSARAKRNDEMRRALSALDDYRANASQRTSTRPKVKIGKEPVALESYLDKIAEEVGIKIPQYSKRPKATKGKYTEVSTKIEIRGLSILELKDLLEKIESKNNAVVITNLHVKRHFRDQEQLDVELVVATYHTAEDTGEEGDGEDEGSRNGKEG